VGAGPLGGWRGWRIGCVVFVELKDLRREAAWIDLLSITLANPPFVKRAK
jgi:hypothetical protein